jgi:copper(I)-binding protein
VTRQAGAVVGLLSWCLLCMAAGSASLRVEGAWVRQVPGSDVAAAYLTLHNTGDRPASIVDIESPAAQSAMIHETSVEGGMSRMRPHATLLVPPGQTVKLAPGGLHVMLMGVKPLAVGQNVRLVLKLADGSSVQVDASVRPLGAQ